MQKEGGRNSKGLKRLSMLNQLPQSHKGDWCGEQGRKALLTPQQFSTWKRIRY